MDDAPKFFRASDAFSWYMERDPCLRSTIVAVAWLDSRPDWPTLVGKLERATRVVPEFRMRLVEPRPRVATPRWVVAGDFDITAHLHRVDSPAPHSPQTVIDLARVAATTAFDPARPLWEFTLVEHLRGGGAALIMKVHHSLTDGIGGMQLALNLFDVSREPTPARDDIRAPIAESLSWIRLLRDSIAHDVTRFVDVTGHTMRAVGPYAVRAAGHPFDTAARLVATTRSIGRMVAPVATTKSPLMSDRGLHRHLDMLTVSLDDLRRAAAAAGGSVNDGFLAAVTGGLRRYHEEHDVYIDELRVTMPISMRTESDPRVGNRITLQRFTVPVGMDDAAARLRAIGVRCRAARDEPALAHTNAIAGALTLLPTAVTGGILKHVDFLASNVPGFTFPIYLAGARVTGYFPFGPTIGAAVNATLLSYDGTCCVGVTIDRAAVPDPDRFMRCLAEGFDEVLTLGGPHGGVARPLPAASARPRRQTRARATHAASPSARSA